MQNSDFVNDDPLTNYTILALKENYNYWPDFEQKHNFYTKNNWHWSKTLFMGSFVHLIAEKQDKANQ